MEQRNTFYEEQIAQHSRSLNRLKKRIHQFGTLRLLLVLGAITLLWLCRAESGAFLGSIFTAFALPFALLMYGHNRLQGQKVLEERLIELNQAELKGLDYDFSAFDGASEQIDAAHSFSLDLDLFGKHSLFQSINRTVTPFGRECLIRWFKEPLDHKEAIEQRQTAVQELADKRLWLQQFAAIGCPGERSSEGHTNLSGLQQLMDEPAYFLTHRLWSLLTWIIPTLWVLLGAAYLLDWVPGATLNLFTFVAIGVAYAPAKAIHRLYAHVNRMEAIFQSYAGLMSLIEQQEFRSETLRKLREQLHNQGISASEAIRELSRTIGGLDQRFSLAGLILNILFLRDIRLTMRLEHWKATHGQQQRKWFDALAQFDAYGSLGAFAFNHPDYTYPRLTDAYFILEGKALGHPLLDHRRCVRNDIHLPKAPWFLIITGANMAGKSTYLRTVGVNYLLACLGVPVCAQELTLSPAHLVTSLRTSDSLASHESYFFAELKRLKMIIDRLQKGERLFIILDEILKGTNSIDKQRGSLALMRELIQRKACGIIATHDLVLGDLEKEYPEAVKDYCFEADIKENELTFSYQLREGVAQNMNACFLMRKIGITF